MLQYSERKDDSILVLEITEQRLEASNAPDLRDLLVGRIETGNEQIVLDLQQVAFMDSSALGALIGGIKKMRGLGTLAVSGANGPVLQLLKLTRMDKVFPLYTSINDAVTELKG
ncbi:STAS domain-containing protein [Yoonia sp.]|uniref:STAS domain-containing protein n=1 Tax=Yoonia sp. TaxID=2212373 RepID=UPI003974E51A